MEKIKILDKLHKRFLFLVACFLCSMPVYAFTIPDNCYTVDLSTAQLGNITLYVPVNYSEYFSTSSNGSNLVNVSSGSISMSALRGNTQYTITFQSFGDVSYRQTSGQYQTYTLNITGINGGTLPILSQKDFMPFKLDTYVILSILLVVGFIWLRCLRL